MSPDRPENPARRSAPRLDSQSEEIHLSLIICTRNRAAQLPACLEAIDTRELAEVSGEIVLVDNGSTDETLRILHDYAEKQTVPVQVTTEPETGLSRARNAGLAVARGDILAFTDDDCYLTPGYFREAARVHAETDYAFWGGTIDRYDPLDAPYFITWLTEPRELRPGQLIPAGVIQGANLVITSALVDAIGPFSERLGAGTPFRCEDIEYVSRATHYGYRGGFVPQMKVLHHHGRRPGAGLEKVMRDNDHARGAYYACFLMLGRADVLRFWLRTTWHRMVREKRQGEIRRFVREAAGALHYSAATASERVRQLAPGETS